MKALIIVDMQAGMFENGRSPLNVDVVVDRLNMVGAYVRAGGGLVVFIQHTGQPGSDYAPGQPGWELLPSLDRRPEDRVVSKTICDSFYDTELDSVLKSCGVEELIIGGWATDYCVDTTVRAAVSHEYQVTVIRDAHTAADRNHLDAASVIEHHNRTWNGLMAPRGGVQVLTTVHVLRALAVDV